MQLKKILLALLFAGISPMASAFSLGEGAVLSHVGEPFSASIALAGSYSPDVKFFQVGSAECRSSIIATSANGCDSVYDGALKLSVRQGADGQYFLKLTGNRGDDLFYRVLIKSVGAAGGTEYKAFEFLPEFGANPDTPAAVELPVVGRETTDGADKAVIAKRPARQIHPPEPRIDAVKTRQSDEVSVESRKTKRVTLAKAAVEKRVESHLQIKSDYGDDIHALQKENGEIEAQIVLLEKHITLLKEVIRLKSQIDTASAPLLGASAPVAVHVPVSVPTTKVEVVSSSQGLLTWLLLGLVILLSALLLWMYTKQERLRLKSRAVGYNQTGSTPAPINERKSLDLTGAFRAPKW